MFLLEYMLELGFVSVSVAPRKCRWRMTASVPAAPLSLTPRRLRADARRNHARLLDAARNAFDEHGTDANLDDIARRAGVGIGTLYRHFPTRQHLMAAVLRDDMAAP